MPLWLTKSSRFRQSWKSLSSMRANCHCLSKVAIKGFWCWLWPFGCVTQWHKCWMLWVALGWGSGCSPGGAAMTTPVLVGNALGWSSCRELGVAGIPSGSGILQAPQSLSCTSADVYYDHSRWNMQMVLSGIWERKRLVSLKADFCVSSLFSWLYQMILTSTTKFHVGMQC